MNAREREGFAMLLQTLLAGTRGDNDEAPSSSTGEGGAIHLRPNAQETIDEPIEETINGPSCETYRNKHIVPGGKGYGKGPKLNLIGGGGPAKPPSKNRFGRPRGGVGRFRRGRRGGRRRRSHSRRRSRSFRKLRSRRRSSHRRSPRRKSRARKASVSSSHSGKCSSFSCESESDLPIIPKNAGGAS